LSKYAGKHISKGFTFNAKFGGKLAVALSFAVG